MKKNIHIVNDQLVPAIDALFYLSDLVRGLDAQPESSSMVTELAEKLYGSFNQCLLVKSPMTIELFRERFFIEDIAITNEPFPVLSLIDKLSERCIRKIIIRTGVGMDELIALARLISTPIRTIIDQGGPAEIICKHPKVHNLSVIETIDDNLGPDYPAESWQYSLLKVGVNPKDVVELLEDSQHAQPCSPRNVPVYCRLSGRETAQICLLLLEPVFFHDLLNDLGQSPSEQSSKMAFDPLKIINLILKVTHFLFLRSSKSEAIINRRLTQALSKLDTGVRVSVLIESLNRRMNGLFSPEVDLFNYSPEEWTSSILETSIVDREGTLKTAKLPLEHWRKIAPLFEQMHAEYFGESEKDRNDFALQLQRFRLDQKRYERRRDALVELAETLKKIHVNDHLVQEIHQLHKNMEEHIDNNYLHTLLGMLAHEKDPKRQSSIASGFLTEINKKAEKNISDILPAITVFLETMDLKQVDQEYLKNFFPPSQSESLVHKLFGSQHLNQYSEPKQKELFSKLTPLVDYLDHGAAKILLDKYYFGSSQTDNLFTAETIKYKPLKIISILEKYLDLETPHFNPRHFLKGLKLYLAINPDDQMVLVNQFISSSEPSIRNATLLRLIQCKNPDVAIPIFKKILWGDHQVLSDDERILAVYGLGVYQVKDAADFLKSIAERSSNRYMQASPELRMAAIYAYAQIGGPSLHKEVSSMYSTVFQSQPITKKSIPFAGN